MNTAKRQSTHCGVWNTCPSCGHFGQRLAALCIHCRPRTRERPDYVVCPDCGHTGRREKAQCLSCREKGSAVCPACGKRKNYGAALCPACCKAAGGPAPWLPDEVAFLVANYPDNGAGWIAARIDKTAIQVRDKANRLKIRLNPEATRRIVHDRAAEHMRANNPSRLPGASERLRQQVIDNPGIYQRLIEGQARLQRDRPSKLETKLAAFLDQLGLTYESHVLIKPNFIVDFRIGSLIIEADGDWWHGHPRYEPLHERQVRQQQRDAARGKYLTACGYKVVRIWESDMSIETVARVLHENDLIA